MKKIFYEKVGRRYRPVYEYDQELVDALPKGSHLIQVYPGGRSIRYNVDPNHAAMIAAGRVAEDAICNIMLEASRVQPPRNPLTEQERAAWINLIEVWGDEARSLRRPAVRDIAEAGVKAMQEEAEKLMNNPVVYQALQNFLLLAELAKKNS